VVDISAARFRHLLIAVCLLSPVHAVVGAETWTASQIAAVLEQRESLMRTVRYSYTTTTRRLPEGTKALTTRLPPGSVLKTDEEDVWERRDFLRVRDQERYYLETTRFGDDMKSIVGKYFEAWDGSVGRRYYPEKQSGRVTTARFKLDGDDPEYMIRDCYGQPLSERIGDPSSNVVVAEAAGGLSVRLRPAGGPAGTLELEYLLDPAMGCVPVRMQVFQAGALWRTVTVSEWTKHTIDGVPLWFPKKISAQTNTAKTLEDTKPSPGRTPEFIPLLSTTVTVHTVDFNMPVAEDQFTVHFPPGTAVYDEHIGRFVPRLEGEDVYSALEVDITKEASTYRDQLIKKTGEGEHDAGQVVGKDAGVAAGLDGHEEDNSPPLTEAHTQSRTTGWWAVVIIAAAALLCGAALAVVVFLRGRRPGAAR